MITRLAALMFTFVFLTQATISLAQDEGELLQFSGMVVTEERKQLVPLPFTNISIKGTTRGTYANLEGFFSIVARKGDVVVFSAVGYKTVEYTIPKELRDNRYSIYQLMVEDTINLPVTMIYPWPSKEHFRIEFLEMDVKDDMYDRALANLNDRTLESLRQGMSYDGAETGSMYLRQQASEYYHFGQLRPMNVFNPLAWRDFIKAWQEGKFKSKKQ
jgi:signal peptidase I